MQAYLLSTKSDQVFTDHAKLAPTAALALTVLTAPMTCEDTELIQSAIDAATPQTPLQLHVSTLHAPLF